MINPNAKLTELLALAGVIDPATTANTERFSTVVDMSRFHQVLVVAQLGNMAAETIDVKVYSCDSDGSNSAALVSATQLAAHASNNDNTQILANVRAEALLASGKRYIRVGIVTGGATGGPANAAILGLVRQGATADQDLSTIQQIL